MSKIRKKPQILLLQSGVASFKCLGETALELKIKQHGIYTENINKCVNQLTDKFESSLNFILT